jgi:hypothetical protein
MAQARAVQRARDVTVEPGSTNRPPTRNAPATKAPATKTRRKEKATKAPAKKTRRRKKATNEPKKPKDSYYVYIYQGMVMYTHGLWESYAYLPQFSGWSILQT